MQRSENIVKHVAVLPDSAAVENALPTILTRGGK
jgi:hypothetical protein